ncbi:homeobox-DDT domain protein RLT3-like [Senna tora]|uniref:Homeobox-DDT domain protein RLT3-like n=1 Tax=Senna tora TaxID=362788 RepID=A0A834WA11_9FABA|nr:homeobox-DDT domain protein RLT3-like [Senna tora]
MGSSKENKDKNKPTITKHTGVNRSNREQGIHEEQTDGRPREMFAFKLIPEPSLKHSVEPCSEHCKKPMGIRRKTPSQLQALDNIYTEEKYPTQRAIEGYAAALGLTYKQVQDWFVEKRRREKRKNGVFKSSCSSLGKKLPIHCGKDVLGVSVARKILETGLSNQRTNGPLSSRYNPSVTRNATKKKKHKCLQELFTADHILQKFFRKDGPPLGEEFDSLPPGAFLHHTGLENFTPGSQDDQGPMKRRKVSKSAIGSGPGSSKKAPIGKHGIGKGLMTVWRATNPDAGDVPIGFGNREVSLISKAKQHKPECENKKPRKTLTMTGKTKNKLQNDRKKLQEKRKLFMQRRLEKSNQDVSQKQSQKEKCELVLDRAMLEEELSRISVLIDDEELEIRELQAGPDLLVCSDHLAASKIHGCSLCKDVLPKFPPDTVKMKKPICLQPWDSSPKIVKKLFKVLHFLYTYAIVVDICPFTLDEFAQAFHDKDSMLLGRIHVALLTLLLSDIEVELTSRFPPHLNKSCNYLALLHSVENQEYSLDFWKRSLNPLTWIEILRQVLVAAGFGSKQGALRREALSKELNLLVNYGLRAGTLKGELFKILSEQGINGSKVSELAKLMQIVELNLASTTEELESLICSTLSSDITLFEKISSSAFRLRMSSFSKDIDEFQSDTEDSGSVDDELNDSNTCCSGDDFESDSGNSNLRNSKHANNYKLKNKMVTVSTEIDESHPGEVWLLGLMESEYSDLSIEEKLNALVALTDLLSSGSSIRMKDPTKVTADYSSSIQLRGSGAKIKRSLVKKPVSYWNQIGLIQNVKEGSSSLNPHSCPVDSSLLISNIYTHEESSEKGKEAKETGSTDSHPIQSVFLGSDRRYNRYWLFLGPCNVDDPGHRRVYFESSEDGHWEVIDTEEALCALLSVLDDRGKREALLIESLEKRKESLCSRIRASCTGTYRMSSSDQSELDMTTEDSYSPVSDVDNQSLSENAKEPLPSAGAVVIEAGKKGAEQVQKWIRLQAYDSWMWNSFYLNLNVVKYGRRSYIDSLARCESCHDLYWRDERHCKICHMTFELDFDLEERYAIHTATCREKDDSNKFPNHKVLSSQIQSLKAAIYAIESVMPVDALVGAWRKSAHKLWVRRLRRTSTLVELLQVVADFVGAINEDWLFHCNFPDGAVDKIITSFAFLPHTSSAFALWLVKLDAIIAPYLDRVQPPKKQEISKR